VLLLGCGWAAAQAPDEVDSGLARAEDRFAVGDLAQAERLFRIAAQSDKPEVSRQAYERLLVIHVRLGRADRAIRAAGEYRALLDRLGDAERARRLTLQTGEFYLALGHHRKAVECFHDVLDDRRWGWALPAAVRLEAWAGLGRAAEQRQDAAAAADAWRRVETEAAGLLDDPKAGLLRPRRVAIGRRLAEAHRARGDADRAVAVLRALLPDYKALNDSPGERDTRRGLAALLAARKDYPAAEAELRRALELHHGLADPEPLAEGDLLAELAALRQAQGQPDEAERLRRQAAAAYLRTQEGAGGRHPHSAEAVAAFWRLERLYERGRQYRLALNLTEAQGGVWTGDTALFPRLAAEEGRLRALFGSYAQAREPLAAALADLDTQDPPNLRELPSTLNALALAEQSLGRPARAEALGTRVLALYRDHGLPDDLALVEAYNVLGTAGALNGDYARAIDHFREGIDRCRKLGPVADQHHSYLLLNVAVLYRSQGEPDESLAATLEALRYYEHFAEPDALGFACFDAALADLYAALGRYAEAEQRTERLLRLCDRYEIRGGVLVVTAKHCRALRRLNDRDAAGAERLWREVLALQEQERVPLLLPRTLNYLGLCAELQGRTDEAEKRYHGAVALQRDNPRALPATHFISLWRLAEVARRRGRPDEARKLLEEAVGVAEAARVRLYGDARQRATFFSQFVMAFELLVDQNVRENRPEEALVQASRGRSRALMDQFQLAGADPRQALTGPRGAEIRQREDAARRRISSIQARAALIPLQEAEGSEAQTLLRQLDEAQREHAAAWREVLNANPLYRGLAADDPGRDALAVLRANTLTDRNGLLVYWIGRERRYLFLVGGPGRPTEVFPLTLPRAVADGLTSAPEPEGPSSRERLRDIVVRPKARTAPPEKPAEVVADGDPVPLTLVHCRLLVDRYREQIQTPDFRPGRDIRLTPRSAPKPLAASGPEVLGRALLPPEARRRLGEWKAEYLIVVPDGPLHRLPLEAVVLEGGERPRYVLDELPPLVYAPSLSMLAVLTSRKRTTDGPATLLTVGEVAYPQEEEGRRAPAPEGRSGDPALVLRGVFPPLPASGEESKRVARLFDPDKVTALRGKEATEKAVRRGLAGKRFVHLAAHGFVDQRFGNLYGALALSPPEGRTTPDDDGLLTLNEIYELPLGDCELAVLSACVTNVGPQGPLEAGVTLGGGFLAAGAARVVASHWSVDDESTAELVATFFEEVTAARRRGGAVSYARALQAARLKVRSRAEWSSPLYWAPFVLVGPPS
jgi:CHAT domain-containing protein